MAFGPPLVPRVLHRHHREVDLLAWLGGIGITLELDAALRLCSGWAGPAEADRHNVVRLMPGYTARRLSGSVMKSAHPQPRVERILAASHGRRRSLLRQLPRPRRSQRRRAQGADPEAHRGGAEGLLPAPHPARQDRHPARRAGQPPAQEARGGRGRDHRRRRPAAHRHPRRQERCRTREDPSSAAGSGVMHCPECGFVNAEGANYCQKCGAYLGAERRDHDGDTTDTYTVDETGELQAGRPRRRVTGEGATLVIRTGGGRGGRDVPARGRPDDDRAQPRRRRLPRRRDRVAQPRAARRAAATASTSTTSAR